MESVRIFFLISIFINTSLITELNCSSNVVLRFELKSMPRQPSLGESKSHHFTNHKLSPFHGTIRVNWPDCFNAETHGLRTCQNHDNKFNRVRIKPRRIRPVVFFSPRFGSAYPCTLVRRYRNIRPWVTSPSSFFHVSAPGATSRNLFFFNTVEERQKLCHYASMYANVAYIVDTFVPIWQDYVPDSPAPTPSPSSSEDDKFKWGMPCATLPTIYLLRGASPGDMQITSVQTSSDLYTFDEDILHVHWIVPSGTYTLLYWWRKPCSKPFEFCFSLS